MIRNRSIWMLTVVSAIATLPMRVAAQPISEQRIKELIKEAADRTARGDLVVGQQPAMPTAANRPVVALAIEDAVKLALERNLDISVQRLNPQINDIAVASVQSFYNPALTSTV